MNVGGYAVAAVCVVAAGVGLHSALVLGVMRRRIRIIGRTYEGAAAVGAGACLITSIVFFGASTVLAYASPISLELARDAGDPLLGVGVACGLLTTVVVFVSRRRGPQRLAAAVWWGGAVLGVAIILWPVAVWREAQTTRAAAERLWRGAEETARQRDRVAGRRAATAVERIASASLIWSTDEQQARSAAEAFTRMLCALSREQCEHVLHSGSRVALEMWGARVLSPRLADKYAGVLATAQVADAGASAGDLPTECGRSEQDVVVCEEMRARCRTAATPSLAIILDEVACGGSTRLRCESVAQLIDFGMSRFGLVGADSCWRLGMWVVARGSARCLRKALLRDYLDSVWQGDGTGY